MVLLLCYENLEQLSYLFPLYKMLRNYFLTANKFLDLETLNVKNKFFVFETEFSFFSLFELLKEHNEIHNNMGMETSKSQFADH